MRRRHKDSTGSPVRWRDLVERAQAKLRAEGLDPQDGEHVDLDAFAARLGRARGLTIRLYPVDLGATASEVCGLCVMPRPDVAFIYYAAGASDLSRQHTIAHELGHLLFEHRSVAPHYRRSLSGALTNSEQRLTAWMGGDPSYEAQDEAEADALGAALFGHAPSRRTHQWVVSADIRAAAARFESAFA